MTALVLVAVLLAPPPVVVPPRSERLARVLALEDARSLGDGELEAILRTGDRGLRRRAALAAGRIGRPELVPALVELLGDPEPEVRQMAAFALGLVGDRRAVDPLLLTLDDADRVVRARTYEALGRLGDPRVGPELARRLLAALPNPAARLTVRGDDPANPADPWMELRLGLISLWRLKDPTFARSVLLTSDGAPRFDWWVATWVAMRLEDPRLTPVLRAAAGSGDPYSRSLAARGLGAIKDGAQIDVLERLLRDRDEMVVVAAIRALGAIGDGRGTALVAPRLQSDRPVLVWEALQALSRLPPDRSLRELIVGHAGHALPAIRGAALQALAHTVPEDLPLILSGMDPDPEWSVRAALASALAERRHGGTEAQRDMGEDEVGQAILLGMLRDPDPRVVAPVLVALARARGADAVPTLERHLQHTDPLVRAAALSGLAERKAPGLARRALDAWDGGRGHEDLRMTAVEVLGEIGPEGLAPLATIAAQDPWRVVRVRASDALVKGGGTAPDPGVEVLSRPVQDYREAMAPYTPAPGVELFTPRAFLHTRRGVIEVHLDVVEAPLTVASFVDLARRGFFDGTVFHRVVPVFVAQGGDPTGSGTGGPGTTLRTESAQRSFGRGIVGMASSGRDTEGSQFFVTLQPSPHLDATYTAFGRVASGMEVADALLPGDEIERVEVWTGREAGGR